MATIKSKKIVGPGGDTRTVQIGSKADKKYSGMGYTDVGSGGTPAPKPTVAPKTTTAGGGSGGYKIGNQTYGTLQEALSAAQKEAQNIQQKVSQLGQSQQQSGSLQNFVSSSDRAVQDERYISSEVDRLSAPDPNLDSARDASENYIQILQDEYKRLEKQ